VVKREVVSRRRSERASSVSLVTEEVEDEARDEEEEEMEAFEAVLDLGLGWAMGRGEEVDVDCSIATS